MGIVVKQSIYNVISIGLAFLIGAANMLYLYPTFPGKEFQGLIIALLANSNLIQPFLSFGVQHTLIKYFTDSYGKKNAIVYFGLFYSFLYLF
jgi:hypothetical protein